MIPTEKNGWVSVVPKGGSTQEYMKAGCHSSAAVFSVGIQDKKRRAHSKAGNTFKSLSRGGFFVKHK